MFITARYIFDNFIKSLMPYNPAHSYFYVIEPRCFCMYTLSGQNDTSINSGNQIMCEKNGGLQPNGQCTEDEYCAGPTTIKDAVCGKKLLCTKKGALQM